MPNREGLRLFRANKLSEPPLCSKKAQKNTEKMMNTRAAASLRFSSALKRRISQNRYTSVSGPMMYMNRSVYAVLVTMAWMAGMLSSEPMYTATSYHRLVVVGRSARRGERAMGPRFFRVKAKVIRLTIITMPTKAKARRQEYSLPIYTMSRLHRKAPRLM